MISNFFILDIKNNSITPGWNLPIPEKKGFIGAHYMKVDQENNNNIYWTPYHNSHYVYFYTLEGKEMNKFGSPTHSTKKGEFNTPCGIALNKKYLYICDYGNSRIQVLNKFNGNFIRQWTDPGQTRRFYNPRAILLYENQYFYIGDRNGIQIWKKKKLKKMKNVF